MSADNTTPIIAPRYKTKLCDKFDTPAGCPYGSNRCMYAHGEAELRTRKMNVEAGLTTRSAVKQHQRDVRQELRKNTRKPTRRVCDTVMAALPAPCAPQTSAPLSWAERLWNNTHRTQTIATGSSDASSCSSHDDVAVRSAFPLPTTIVRRWRHDPYATVVFAPVYYSSEEEYDMWNE